MISVEQAVSIIQSTSLELKTHEVKLLDATGYILAEDIHAERDIPPFDRVMMDGIAIRFSSLEDGLNAFEITGTLGAGDILNQPVAQNQCIEIMTGAALPSGLDTVIPYEHLEIADGMARIKETVKYKQNVHPIGFDQNKGNLLLSKGKRIDHVDIGILASEGKSVVHVFAPLKVAIVSTGNELVDIEEKPLAHQIRKSNVHVLASIMTSWKADIQLFHFADDRTQLENGLREILQSFPVIMLSGGVSKGKFDYVPEILMQLGVSKQFHGISQKPGKPFWFGATTKNVVFALPGNPVSTVVCCKRYILPWIEKHYMQLSAHSSVMLAEDYVKKTDLTYFLPVCIQHEHAVRIAQPMEGHGSGDYVHLSRIDGWLELSGSKGEIKKGSMLPFIPK